MKLRVFLYIFDLEKSVLYSRHLKFVLLKVKEYSRRHRSLFSLYFHQIFMKLYY